MTLSLPQRNGNAKALQFPALKKGLTTGVQQSIHVSIKERCVVVKTEDETPDALLQPAAHGRFVERLHLYVKIPARHF